MKKYQILTLLLAGLVGVSLSAYMVTGLEPTDFSVINSNTISGQLTTTTMTTTLSTDTENSNIPSLNIVFEDTAIFSTNASVIEKTLQNSTGLYQTNIQFGDSLFSFTPASNVDYSNNILSSSLTLWNDLKNSANVNNVTQSGTSGNQTISVNTSATGEDLEQVWSATIATITDTLTEFNTGTVSYQVEVVNTNENVSLNALIYDNESVTQATNLGEYVTTLEEYVSSFGQIDSAKIFSSYTSQDNLTSINLYYSDSRPDDSESISNMVNSFLNRAYDDAEVRLPWACVTSLFFAEETAPFYVEYPSNLEWY